MAGKHSLTFYLVLLHIIIMPLVPAKIYAGPLPISAEVILIPALTVVAIAEYMTGRIRLNSLGLKTFMTLFGIFFLIQVISLSQADSLLPGLKEIVRYVSYAILFYIVTKVKFSDREYKTMGITFVSILAVVGVWGIIQYAFDINLNKAGVYALEEAYGRVQSTMVNPNYWAGFINFILPILLLFAVVFFKDRKWQLIMFAVFGVYVINQIFTYTRSAWLIMAMAILLTSLLIPKQFYKKLFTIHLIGATLLLGVIVYSLPDVQERTTSAMYVVQSFIPSFSGGGNGGATDGDGEVDEEKEKDKALSGKAVTSRTTLWKTGLVMYQENPTLGVGIGNYDVRYKEYVTKYPELYVGHDQYSVHNSYLKVAAETGTIGVLSFLAIYLYYFLFLGKQFLFRREDLAKKVLLIGLFVGTGTFMGQNLANNLIFIPQVNVIFWLVSGLIFNYVHSAGKIVES
ncbi:O-antigen ligase family protein [Pontibacillus yanchengensis]|uniref:O-antigen ligase family protein n=2 Tax=Pontibacillus yanchengensis TaxID=462910 RepID=A0A6I5A0H5_9BACI|nr:O-antigen ligase family protein [Pontibacillus yanchengensis]MYL34267.1 O-antigen ligase family protein [Pontibacillus yanchengensis]MYL53738.1 O-antigen ligase family protein [Pontibacillus yanchengensis]